jgi:hypothetical protein
MKSKIIETHHLKHPFETKTTYMGIPSDYKNKLINELYRIGDQQENITNVKAFMTSYTLYKETSILGPFLKNLKRTIELMYGTNHEKYEFDFSNIWGAIYKKGHYTIPHHHNPSYLSWVYYLQTTHESSPLVFPSANFTVHVEEDLLVVFPSHVIHSVPKHTAESDRICLAGNIDLEAIQENHIHKLAK